MAETVGALFFDTAGRILLVRVDDGERWEVPWAPVDEGEDAWDTARYALKRRGFEGLALRRVVQRGEREYWLVAGRSGSYESPGDFFAVDELPPIADPEEAEIIRDARAGR